MFFSRRTDFVESQRRKIVEKSRRRARNRFAELFLDGVEFRLDFPSVARCEKEKTTEKIDNFCQRKIRRTDFGFFPRQIRFVVEAFVRSLVIRTDGRWFIIMIGFVDGQSRFVEFSSLFRSAKIFFFTFDRNVDRRNESIVLRQIWARRRRTLSTQSKLKCMSNSNPILPIR